MGIKGNNKGFSLIEVLIATALVGVAAVGTTQLFVGQSRQMRNLQVKANVDQLRNVVQSAALNPNTILYTAGKMASGALINPDMNKCVVSTGITDTNKDCSDGTVFPSQRVFAPDGHEVTGLYTANGVRCADAASGAPTPTPGEMCPYKVSASFRATWPPASSNLTAGGLCARAQMIQIGWKIEQGYQSKNTPFMKPIEADFDNNKSAAYAVPVSVQSIQAVESAQVSCSPAPFTTSMLTSHGGPYDDTKYGSLVGQSFPQTVTSVDAYGQQICGIDDGAVQAASLKTEVCKLWVTSVWKGTAGGHDQSTTPTCDLLVIKNFVLSGTAGSKGYLSDDCDLASSYHLISNKGLPSEVTYIQSNATAIWGLTGGRLKHLNGTDYTAAETTSLASMYQLNLADSMDGRVTCMQPVYSPKYWPLPGPSNLQHGNCGGGSPCNFALSAAYLPGSMILEMIGGGGGGNDSEGSALKSSSKHGGNGGNAGVQTESGGRSYPDAQPNNTCYVNVGGQGGGNSGGGGATTFYCGGAAQTSVNGGGGGNGHQGGHGGSNGASPTFAGSYWQGGYASSSASGAADINHCGAGGGGGNYDNGNHSGGPGANGCFRAHWQEITWPAPWAPSVHK